MKTLYYTLATAGHIDHGKSALVRALTGAEPDRLPEEKLRGMTIEPGFTFLQLPSIDGDARYELGIVDVPGHEDFIRNMIAGAASVNAVLLTVAVDDGWMPQTEEHLQILSHLGLQRGIVALTKCDLAGDISPALKDIGDHLHGSFLETAPIVATSSVTGAGLDELRRQIASMLRKLAPPRNIGKPRLPVDRIFCLKGVGAVATGTLIGGELSAGQAVTVQPQDAKCHVRTLQTHGGSVDTTPPGARVALNLPELAPGHRRTKDSRQHIQRGDVVTIESLAGKTSAIDVRLDAFARWPAFDFHNGLKVWVHHCTAVACAQARIVTHPDFLLARLQLEDALPACVGDRIVIRDWSQQKTLGGGVILDLDAKPLSKTGEQLQLLATRAVDPGDVIAYVTSAVERDRCLVRANLLRQSNFSDSQVADAVHLAGGAGRIIIENNLLFSLTAWNQATTAAAATIDAFHREHPELPGAPMAELRKAFLNHGITDSAPQEEVMRWMLHNGFERRGSAIARANHRIALPPRLAKTGERLRSMLNSQALNAQARKMLAPDEASCQALRFLITAGEAVELDHDVVISAEAYRSAIAQVEAFLRRRGSATVSELKTSLSTTRRIVVPLLEKLDRGKITRRQGDARVLATEPHNRSTTAEKESAALP